MSTVNEIYEQAKRLISNGHGDKTVYAIHGASGVSYEVDLGSEDVKEDYHDAGPLCEEENGYEFVSAYLD